jgi:hypothetical protein
MLKREYYRGGPPSETMSSRGNQISYSPSKVEGRKEG